MNNGTVPTETELPPHDAKSEACALGCVLASVNSSADGIFEKLKIEHFYDLRHKTIYRALQALQADGKHLESPELDIYLRAKKLDTDAGGDGYYLQLTELIPSRFNFPTYFEDLEDLRTRRAIISDTASMAALARDKAIPHKTLADAHLRLLSAHAETAKKRLPGIRTAEELDQDPKLIAPPEIIQGVLHQGSKCTLAAPAKARKTWSQLDLSLSLTNGAPWWGFETRKGKVLYINFELQEAFLLFRLRKLAQARGLALNKDLHLRTLRGHSAPLYKLIPEFIQLATAHEYRLIILDPIYKGLGGRDENSAGDVSELCNELEQMSVATGAAVMFATHFSKGNQATKSPLDRASGSGVFGRDADSTITMTEHDEDKSFTIDFILRNFLPQAPLVVTWDYPLMLRNPDLDPQDLKGKGGRPKETDSNDLLNIIPAEGVSRSDFYDLAQEHLKISKSKFYRNRDELLSRGKIRWSETSKLWTKVP